MPENLSVTISAADGNSLAHMSEIEKNAISPDKAKAVFHHFRYSI